MQPINRLTFNPHILNISSPCRRIITSYLSPKDCAQSLFRTCTAFRSTAFNWENLKVVVLNAPEEANKLLWSCQLLTANGQDFGLKLKDWEDNRTIYSLSRNETFTHLSLPDKCVPVGFALNRFYFSSRDSSDLALRSFQATDQGLIENEPLHIPSKDNSPIDFIAELPKNQSDKTTTLKFFIERMFDPKNFRISTYENGWSEEVHNIQGRINYRPLGQILYILEHKFLDLTNALKPILISTKLGKKLQSNNRGRKQFLFRGINERLIAVQLKEKNGKKELVERWTSDCSIPTYFEIEDNEHLIFIKDTWNSFVLDARTGRSVYDLSVHNQVWLKRDAVIFVTQNNALTVVEPLSKNKTVRTAQIPFSRDQHPILDVAYRIFSESPTKPAEHMLCVIVRNGLKDKLTLKLEADQKQQAVDQAPSNNHSNKKFKA